MREGDGGDGEGGNHRTSINSNMQIFSFISDEKNPKYYTTTTTTAERAGIKPDPQKPTAVKT